MTNILKAALEAAEMGFRAFPADPKTKRPLVKGWPEIATRDPQKIKELFEPFYNPMLAVVIHESGWVTLDIDVKENECAFKKLKAFEALHGGRLIPAFAIRTPSLGLHLYFKAKEGIEIRNNASKIAKGFDIRGSGGYCIFAGSVRHDGKTYEFISNFEEAYNDA